MEIRKVGLIGAGQMGNGIAQVCAASGFEVLMHDISAERINAGLATINGNLSRLIAKGSMDEAARQAQLALINSAPNLEDLDDCDIIIEAATENESVKKQIFINLCKVIGKRLSSPPIHPRFPSRVWPLSPTGLNASSASIS